MPRKYCANCKQMVNPEEPTNSLIVTIAVIIIGFLINFWVGAAIAIIVALSNKSSLKKCPICKDDNFKEGNK